jgi:hypothetical protein
MSFEVLTAMSMTIKVLYDVIKIVLTGVNTAASIFRVENAVLS